MEEKKLTRTLTVTGMSCASCVRIVERSLSKVPGVKFAAVNLATETAFVILEKDVPLETLEKAVHDAGYGTSRLRPSDLEGERYAQARRSLALALVVTVPLMVMMALHMTGHHVPGMAWAEVVGGAVAIFGAGWSSLRGAWIALTHNHANMDVLVMLGALSAWATAIMHSFGFPVSFGSTGPMIVALHLLGRYIESRLRDRAAREIRALLAIQSKEARVLLPGGEEMVPVDMLKVNSSIRIKPGERIPADAKVTVGTAAVDESMLTGEPIPVAKVVGDELTGGSILISGTVDAMVNHVGEDSFLSHMIAMIQEAQGAKIPIQAFADRVTNVFVPIVFTMAVFSALFWGCFGRDGANFLDIAGRYLPWVTGLRNPVALSSFGFLSTLLIACPCALGLATPMALIAGTGAASRKGLIIRNAEAIQTVGKVGAAILDKTGTLTLGRPEVVWHNLDAETVKLVASMEAGSSHPLAKAILKMSPDVTPFSPIEEKAGEGIIAQIGGHRWYVGRPAGPEGLEEQLDAGRTVVEVRCDDKRVGAIALEDPMRPETPAAIKRLEKMGVLPVMATGDNEMAAHRVGKLAGIEEICAEVRPQDKLSLVRDYQGKGCKVLMMGDGINDAAALKGADVGVAVGSGSELAVESADMVIVRGGVESLAEMLRISRKTFAIIRQNLFWAFAYNLVALPLAMTCLLHPLIAEVSMMFSSISVILNSVRIGRD